MTLSAKHQQFADNLLADGEMNATRAYQKTYPGTTEEAARRSASRLLTHDDVKTYLKAAQKNLSERTGITAERVVRELASIGFADTTQAIYIKNGKVKVKDTDKLDSDTRRAISEIRETVTANGGTLAIKFHDKKGALELLGRHLGVFDDNEGNDVPTPTTVVINTVDGRKPS